jgi:hypothetical protein
MRDAPLSRRSIRLLIFSYVSALSIILLLLISGQTLIQLTLIHEQHQRTVAALINAQELRDQRMFYNVILLQNPEGNGVDYQAINMLVKADETTWEATQNAMYTGNAALGIAPADFSSAALARIAKARPGFLVMETAYRHIFLLEQQRPQVASATVRPFVDTIYLADASYLQSLIAVYSDLVSQADQQVGFVREIEEILFALTVLVMLCEALLVVRPAIAQLQKHMQILAETFHRVEAEQPRPPMTTTTIENTPPG